MNFVVWGSIHGVIFSAEAIVKRYNLFKLNLPGLIQMLYPFLVFTFSLIFFRAETLNDSIYMVSTLFEFSGFMGIEALSEILKGLFISSAIMNQMAVSFFLFILIDILIGQKDFSLMVKPFYRPVRWVVYFVLILWILYFGRFDIEPTFVYFQF